jgi:hypothetical protein
MQFSAKSEYTHWYMPCILDHTYFTYSVTGTFQYFDSFYTGLNKRFIITESFHQ